MKKKLPICSFMPSLNGGPIINACLIAWSNKDDFIFQVIVYP